jgi:hypothetical protein
LLKNSGKLDRQEEKLNSIGVLKYILEPFNLIVLVKYLVFGAINLVKEVLNFVSV